MKRNILLLCILLTGNNLFGQKDIITFADATVKALCVANWDSDGDGELSKAEAASVTSLGSVFKYNWGIKPFNELQYFTGLTSIGEYAFYGCVSLTSITIPESVTSIGNSAFYGCHGLTSITIPKSVTSIGDLAFKGCRDLTSITIPESVTSIGNSAFAGCRGLTSITIPNSVTSIGIFVFYGCSALTSITIPNSVTSIGEGAFNACSRLKALSVELGNAVYDSRDNCNAIIHTETKALIAGCQNTIIPANVTSIGDHAFSSCSGLASITIPNGVTSIGNDAFSDCSGLTSITIPESVTSIGDLAFHDCRGLTSITIPESVTNIGDFAFSGCSGLASITIPEHVKNIGDYAFKGCSGLASITIPESVTSIGNSAFAGCRGLTSITIPNSVTTIGDYAFKYCSGLTSITIPEGVRSIGDGTFYGCSGLTSITIPESVTSIGSDAFYKCSGLTSINIPESVTSIGSDAFEGCSSLTSITIPNSVTTIGDYAFKDCSDMISITISNSVTAIGKGTFAYCSGLNSITIPESVTSIGDDAFYDCTSLTSVTIPESVTSIGDYAFYGCSSLTTVIVESIIPISVSDHTFCNKELLYVPLDCGDTYKAADVWKDFKEIRELGTELTLVDGESYNRNTNVLVEDLHYSRSFKNTKWQAWYVPFDLTLTSEIMEHFSFAKFAGTYTEEDGSFYITVVRLKEGDVVKANTPYCVQAKVADSANPQVITLTDATLKTAEENSFYVLSARKKITFQGNYSRRTVTADDQNWYALSGGQYSRQLPGNTIAPYRCFFTIEDREDNPYASTPNPATVKLMVLGEETGITDKKGEEQREKGSDEVFDLNGHRINQQNMRKGIYIVNGKKVFVK